MSLYFINTKLKDTDQLFVKENTIQSPILGSLSKTNPIKYKPT